VVLLENLDIEFEIKKSNIIDFFGNGYLSSCVCEVTFDDDNIEYLQDLGEVESAATLKMQVISSDKRCMKTIIKEKELNDMLSRSIPQRLFLPDDAIQIQINNKRQDPHLVILKPMDLPLMLK